MRTVYSQVNTDPVMIIQTEPQINLDETLFDIGWSQTTTDLITHYFIDTKKPEEA